MKEKSLPYSVLVLFLSLWTTVAAQTKDSLAMDTLSTVGMEQSLIVDTISVDTIVDISISPMNADSLIDFGKQFLGAPYRYAATGEKGSFDCSGFVRFVFAHYGIPLPHSSQAQYEYAKSSFIPMDSLQMGDLVFFQGRKQKSISHVGIFIHYEEEMSIFTFIHASCSSGVCISRSDEPYYRNRYVGAGRVLGHTAQ